MTTWPFIGFAPKSLFTMLLNKRHAANGVHTALWVTLALLVSGALAFAGDAVELALGFYLLYLFPGYLSLNLLNLRHGWSRVQRLALASGFGLTEALVMASGAIILGSPTRILAYVIVGLTAVKIIALWRWSLPLRELLEAGQAKAAVLPLLLLCILALAVLWNNLRAYPVYTWTPSDTWNYLQVQVQFSDNPGQLNLQPRITATSVNLRLIWNGWLYNLAMLNDVAQADPVVMQQRDGLYALFPLALLAWAAVGRELFRDRQAAWLAALLQLGFVLSGSGSYFTERLLEDKFFSYFIFIPIVYMLLLRCVRQPERRSLALFVFLGIGMALIHPFNPVALLVTAGPFVVFHWLVNRDWLSIRRTAPLLVIMALLLAYPVLMQITLVREAPPSARNVEVGEGLEQSRSVPLDYSTPFAWSHTFRQFDFLSLYALTFTAILFSGLRARHDIAAHFAFAVSASIVLLIWAPPFAALGVLIMTRSQNWRIFMLLPGGYAITYLLMRAWGWLGSKINRSSSWLNVGWGALAVIVLAFIWGWPQRFPTKLPGESMSPAEQTAFAENRSVVGAGRVLAAGRLSRAIPTLWPDATTPISARSSALSDEAVRALQAVLEMSPDALPDQAIRDHSLDYFLLSHATPLTRTIATEWPCCVRVYENEAVVLYQVRYDLPLQAPTVEEIESPQNFVFGDFARLRGYRIHEFRGGMQVTLYWEPITATSRPYTVFVHLLGAVNPATGSTLWTQDDHPPRLNQTPTTDWIPGDLLRDAYWLDTASLPPATYTLSIGMYDSISQERVAVRGKSENSLEDVLELQMVTVGE